MRTPSPSSLGLKFGLTVGAFLLLFSTLISVSLYYYLRSQAIRDAADKTGIIMAQAESLGGYVRETLRPKMYELLSRKDSEIEFIVEAMSTTHITQAVMKKFNGELPDYSYRRMSDKPINAANKVDAAHQRLLRYFEEHRDESAWRGFETVDNREFLVFARPIVSDASCLVCHASAASAPKAIRVRYGESAQYGWLPDAVVGVETVSVPLDVAFAKARSIATDLFLFGLALFSMLFIGLTATFRHLVSKPLDELSATFRNIARGKEQLGTKPQGERTDEIGELTESFNMLAQHLLEAENKLREKAELEKQIMQTEKLAALGQLSAGVAHEINNPLGGIKVCLNNLQSAMLSGQAREEHMKVINDAIDRIQRIVRQLLDYAKNSPLSMKPVSLNDILSHVLDFVAYTIRQKNIALRIELAENMPFVLADSDKLEQVFLNLLINAVQAIGLDGIISVKTSFTESRCIVTVSDSGPGIPSDIIEKVFDPFFTTKEVGQGTGLGLTVSKAIIEQHGGSINIASSPAGTVFRITLPKLTQE